MDVPNTIVIVGGEENNQAKLSTLLKPVKIDNQVGLAITSIFHGEVYNINESNNNVYFRMDVHETIYSIRIATGHYLSTYAVLKAISNRLQKRLWDVSELHKPSLSVSLRRDGMLTVAAQNMTVLLSHKRDTPWKMLGVNKKFESTKQDTVRNVDFTQTLEPAFLYVNIVEQSFLNGKLSRLLSMIPISMKAHWSYHEFAQPKFVPIDVKEFSKIILELRDMDGNYVPFEPHFKTIITLQTNRINRSD